MNQSTRLGIALLVGLSAASAALAEKYYLLTGVDVRHYPGQPRLIPPATTGADYVCDGDRLAGTSDVGTLVPFRGVDPQPMYQPNHLGSLSLMFRRGHIPYFAPILGIEFLGGPLLDLDGDLNNGQRSLIPTGATPVEIPGTNSFIELNPNLAAGTIGLVDFDATGCNEGGPGIAGDIATILVTIAGTQPDGSKAGPINPGIDTRVGTVTPFAGTLGTLVGVYRVANLGFEMWEDTIALSGTYDQLGTMQFLGHFDGWLIQRTAATGQFPILAGYGLGSTRWPDVDTAHIGQSFHVATTPPGGLTTIASNVAGDNFTTPGNGGLTLTDYGGDLGAYLDAVVVPRIPAGANRFVYLESAGFGINNSNDPVFQDTIGYDVTLIAAGTAAPVGCPGDCDCDGRVGFSDIDYFVAAISDNAAAWTALYQARHGGANPPCPFANCDITNDGHVNFADIDPFVALIPSVCP